MNKKISSAIFAGLSGGAGKTLCTLGVTAALTNRGLQVASFKKGPDFIDPMWLSRAAALPCRNLDVFLMGEKQTKDSFLSHAKNADISVIEGNRGLFDGFDKKGSFSTANLAKLIDSNIFLIINCTKMTGTAAALVMGCQAYDPHLKIAGIILNRVAGQRHEKIIRDSIACHTKIPVVGAIPKLKNIVMFERHLGLIPPQEHNKVSKVINEARNIAENYIDIGKILRIIKKSTLQKIDTVKNIPLKLNKSKNISKIRIGIIKDKAFNFYYPENLESLQNLGAELIEINAIKDKKVPDLDLLYIGGGFPETQAHLLEKNITFRKSLKNAIEKGLRVYAECGGAVYLGNKLRYKDKLYSMSGIFPVDYDFSPKPKGHGYSILKIKKKNPFFKVGKTLKGHEFHYTYPVSVKKVKFAAEVKRGFGFDGNNDCLIYKNVFASYTHLHALGVKNWAKCLLK